ncbi:hypothetical protein BD779DRAFT_1476592 [Infundibulicybe gibba]|nr:hypothetical protein BD779DRAFT_1476592 [Infundibulicybe gibba]
MEYPNSPLHKPPTSPPQPIATFDNQNFTFAKSSAFNQIAGDLHNGDVTHYYDGSVSSNNVDSGASNNTGPDNITGPNNTRTSDPRAATGSDGRSNNADGRNLRRQYQASMWLIIFKSLLRKAHSRAASTSSYRPAEAYKLGAGL